METCHYSQHELEGNPPILLIERKIISNIQPDRFDTMTAWQWAYYTRDNLMRTVVGLYDIPQFNKDVRPQLTLDVLYPLNPLNEIDFQVPYPTVHLTMKRNYHIHLFNFSNKALVIDSAGKGTVGEAYFGFPIHLPDEDTSLTISCHGNILTYNFSSFGLPLFTPSLPRTFQRNSMQAGREKVVDAFTRIGVGAEERGQQLMDVFSSNKALG